MAAEYISDLPEEWQTIFKERLNLDWVKNCKVTLDWFLSFIEPKDWDDRKKNVARYFKSQQDFMLADSNSAAIAMEEERARIAFHEDWVAWYLYLIESIFERPVVDEIAQGSRIYPFFSAIGRHVKIARKIIGIDEKINGLMNGRSNQPDATLFEIMIAITYARNGWQVEFIPETAKIKTPDLLVKKDGETFYVECKRQSKVTEYSEVERREWRARWAKLIPALLYFDEPVFIDVNFKTEIANTSIDILEKSYLQIMQKGNVIKKRMHEDSLIKLTVKRIDLERLNDHFDNFFVRQNSPQLVSLLADGFKSSDSFTHLISPTSFVIAGPDDEYHALNVFCTGVKKAFCARWVCNAEESIEKKAKDVKKLLSKAVKQAPEGLPTIVHIAYETLHGPHIEFRRAAKIESSLKNFDCNGKNICAIYCHAIQPSVSETDWEIAETTTRYGRNGFNPQRILSHDLMLDGVDTPICNDTHWNQDLIYKN